MWKSKIFKIIKFLSILVLMVGWIFSGWSLALALETATSSPTSTDAVIVQEQSPTSTETATSSPTSTDASIVQGQADEESASEEVAPPQEPVPLPIPPLKERTLRRDVRITHQAGHRCGAEMFRIDISGKVSAQARILLSGKKVQSGEVEIGSLPLGIDILFLKNGDYLESVSQNDDAFDVEIRNQEGSQKGSFSVPILYTDTESNQITVCQINIINF